MDINQKLQLSSHVYDHIAQDNHQGYPFATGIYHAPFVKPIIRQIRKSGQSPIRLTEIGPNNTPIIEFLSQTDDIHYIGLEASPIVTQQAQAKFINQPHIQMLNIPILSDDKLLELKAHQTIYDADLVYASYVGPSIGLINVVRYIATHLSSEMLVIDRIYDAKDILRGRITDYSYFIGYLMKHCLIHRVRFPMGEMLRQITQPIIYDDKSYQDASDLWKSNETGHREQVREQLMTIGNQFNIVFKIVFVGDVILLTGKKR